MKAIYEPKGRALEYSFLACNLYSGCSHGCTYCYAPAMLHVKRPDFHRVVQARYGIIGALRKEAPLYAGTDKRVLLCFSCDPYSEEAKASGYTRHALEVLREHDIPFQILTKGGTRAVDDFDLYRPHDAFATTLTTMGSEAWTWEPGAAEPSDRLTAIKEAKQRGIETWVSLEPVMDPEWSLRIIDMTWDAVDLYKIGKLNHDKALEAKIEKEYGWGRFGWQAVELCDRYGVSYYVKDDLRKHMMDVGQAALRNTDTRKVVR